MRRNEGVEPSKDVTRPVGGGDGASTPRRWSPGSRRLRLLFAAAFFLGAALLVVLIATEGGDVDPTVDAPPFLTATGCQGCHNISYQGWLLTEHARAWDGLQSSGNATSVCEPCHTTGHGLPGGFVDNVTTPEMVNVQCEECHGPGSNHAGAPPQQKKQTIVVNYSAEACGECHQGEHHPFYSEWSLSGHADALVNLRGSPIANDSCLQCHAADYILESEPSLRPTIDTAKEGITCIVCHDPHSNQYGKQLRMPREQLCASCHNPGPALPGDPIFHPQSSMRAGYSSADVPADQFMPTVDCEDCHMYSYRDPARIPPVVTGHSFRQKPEACVSCHSLPPFELSVEEAAVLIDRWQGETVDLLSSVQYHVAQAEVALKRAPSLGFGNTTLNDAQKLYDKANYSKNFVTADGSMGAHNPDYSKSLLLDAKLKAQQVVAMLTPGRVTGRVVNADGVGVGGIDVRTDGETWTTTDSEGGFSFQYAQGTHSFGLYQGDARVGTISNVLVVANEEANVGTVAVAVPGGGTLFWYVLLVLIAVAAASIAYLYGRRRRGGEKPTKKPDKSEAKKPEEPEPKAGEEKEDAKKPGPE